MSIDRETVRRIHRHADARSVRHPIVVLADNVDKASNLGSILRTAEAFRCENVVTNRKEEDTRGAMGAEHWQPVEWDADILLAAHRYQGQGYSLVALEQDERGQPLNTFKFPLKTVLAVGSEVGGVSHALMTVVEDIVYIPQSGLIKSLNVSTATAIALYEYARQQWMTGFEQPHRNFAPSAVGFRMPKKREIQSLG